MEIFNLICDMQFQAICFVFWGFFFFCEWKEGISRHNVNETCCCVKDEKALWLRWIIALLSQKLSSNIPSKLSFFFLNWFFKHFFSRGLFFSNISYKSVLVSLIKYDWFFLCASHQSKPLAKFIQFFSICNILIVCNIQHDFFRISWFSYAFAHLILNSKLQWSLTKSNKILHTERAQKIIQPHSVNWILWEILH